MNNLTVPIESFSWDSHYRILYAFKENLCEDKKDEPVKHFYINNMKTSTCGYFMLSENNKSYEEYKPKFMFRAGEFFKVEPFTVRLYL